MFWTDTSGDRIYTSRLDASQRTTLISSGLSSAGISRIQLLSGVVYLNIL